MSAIQATMLNELIHSLGRRVGLRMGTRPAHLTAEARLLAACADLGRRGGEASRIAIAEQALADYEALDEEAKTRFFRHLLEDYDADADAVRAAYAAWQAVPEPAQLTRLFDAVEPGRQELLRRLNHPGGATLRLLRMREDLLARLKRHPELEPIDHDLTHLFLSWFNRGFLVLRRIDWDTPASILERIVNYEAVHEIRSWDDLRRRLDPVDRRCYAFFHPATGDEPLIFVEVALCAGIPDEVDPLLSQGRSSFPARQDTAVFYSISNCQGGLKGISFGNFLIKQVVAELTAELPAIRTFVTLSPVPGFARWLAGKTTPPARDLADRLAAGDWVTDTSLRQVLRPAVQALAAEYITAAKTGDGAPEDPVARFHLGNGASAHRINWPADLDPGALDRSHGVMMNYLYEPSRIEERHEAFVTEGAVACGPEVKRLLKAARQAKEQEGNGRTHG